MEFRLLTNTEKATYRDELLEMLQKSDKDFVPPISSRFSATQTDFSPAESRKQGFVSYYEDMVGDEILAAFEDGVLLGFVSYKRDLVHSVLTSDTLPNLYICTLLVKPEARGKHLTARMYSHLFDELYPEKNLYTRTWSTNAAHIAILAQFGFSELHRIPNDRGEGIDTVYFCKRRG